MSERRVVVTGMGVVTPIGLNIEDYWNSLIQGKSGIDRLTRFDVSEFTSRIGGELKNFNPQDFDIEPKKTTRIDRFVQYALAAAKEAFESSGLDMNNEDPFRCGCIVGSGIGGLLTVENEHKKLLNRGPKRVSPFLIPAMIIDIASGEVAIKYGLKGLNYGIVSACASSAHGIGDSLRMIRSGDADVIITGGSEASITPLGLAGFCSARALSTRNDDPQKACRPFDKERDGFIMAEGAGILVLEELAHAKKREARILAEIAGYGATADAYHITAPHPEGRSGAQALRVAIEDAKINKEEVDYINAHGTSTQLNDKTETKVLKDVFGEHATNLAISSTKSMAGHLLGAAGAIEIIACIKTINENIIHPTINYENPDPDCDLDYVPNEAREAKVNVALSNSLGFGGHNAAVVIKRFSD
jgi:3-oxoacyl-[acyl-carrier-protein] synthase II